MPRGWLVAPLMFVLLSVAPVEAAEREWVSTGSPIRTGGGSLVVLLDGTPLLFGLGPGGVERYRPETGAWTVVGTAPGISFTTLTPLTSGRVLMSGGPTPTVYDPALNTSAPTGPMVTVRTGAATTVLSNGKVLVIGGQGPGGALLGSSEIYDPATNAWSSVSGVLTHPRFDHAVARLPDGKVLIAGGIGPSGTLASAEIFDPATATWTPAAVMEGPRGNSKAVALKSGRVLVAGIGGTDINSEVYDPSSGLWSSRVLIMARAGATLSYSLAELVVIGDGRPMAQLRTVSGLAGAFLSDPSGSTWQSVGSPSGSASGSLAALPDGRALSVGSVAAQLFRPDNSTSRLVVTPSSIVVDASVGSSTQRSLSIQNTGGTTLVGSIAPLSPPFSAGAETSFALAPGASATIGVQFTPSAPGAFTDNLLLASNGNWAVVPLSGFTATQTGIVLSGRVTDTAGEGVAGVRVGLTGAATATAFTDADGHYRFLVQPNNGYIVTPTGLGVTFVPLTRSTVVATQGMGGLDFTATFPPSHIGVFRGAAWSLDLSGNEQWDGCGVDTCVLFGLPTDKPVVGDWAGAGRARVAVFRDGAWFFDFNGNGQWDGCSVDRCRGFGLAGDEPVAGDWTASGTDKIGVFRNGQWFLDLDGNGQWNGCGPDACFGFGLAGDRPVVGDWSGNGRAKIGVFRGGRWFLDLNGNGIWDGCAVDACLEFGLAGDLPVVGDWTGTGQTKIGVFRDGVFYLDLNGNGEWDDCQVDACINFGLAGDQPIAGFW